MREMIMDRPAQLDMSRKYTVEDMRRMAKMPEYADCRFELIEGRLVEVSEPNELHGYLMLEIGLLIRLFLLEHAIGRVVVETGHHSPADEYTLLGPDVAFRRLDVKANPPASRWVAQMPDLAVEIKSPNDTYAAIQRKADLYLQRGTQLVWLVYPDRRGVDVCRLDEDGEMQREFVNEHGALNGEDVLPGFTLELSRLFS